MTLDPNRRRPYSRSEVIHRAEDEGRGGLGQDAKQRQTLSLPGSAGRFVQDLRSAYFFIWAAR